jgi:hypothetical protein
MWIPVAVDFLCVLDGREVMHAAPTKDVYRRPKRRKTVDAVCGKRAKPYGVSCSTPDSADGVMLVEWPPRITQLPGGMTRCLECQRSTGNRKPAGAWSHISAVMPA